MDISASTALASTYPPVPATTGSSAATHAESAEPMGVDPDNDGDMDDMSTATQTVQASGPVTNMNGQVIGSTISVTA